MPGPPMCFIIGQCIFTCDIISSYYSFRTIGLMLLKALKGVFSLDKRLSLNLRNHSLIAAFVCSGAAYRVYSSWDQHYLCSIAKTDLLSPVGSTLSLLKNRIPSHFVCFYKNTDFDSAASDLKSGKESETRLEKMLLIRKWVVDELPTIFSRRIFNTVDLFCPETVLEIERNNSHSLYFR